MAKKTYEFGKSTFPEAEAMLCIRDEGASPVRISSGVRQLDAYLGGGFPPRTFGVVGAVDGVGKSMLALHSVAHSKGLVGLVSCEDGPDMVAARLLSDATGVAYREIYGNRYRQAASRKKVLRYLDDSGFMEHAYITYSSGPDSVLADVDRMGERGVKLVWVDYLQKLVCDRMESDAFSRSVTDLTKKHDMHVMFLSQYTKPKQDKEGNFKPMSRFEMKHSSGVYQGARFVGLLEPWNDGVKLVIDKANFWSDARGKTVYFERAYSGALQEISGEQLEYGGLL